jgi:uncharacterized protein with HEPN domain
MKRAKPSNKQRLEQILDAIEYIEKSTIEVDLKSLRRILFYIPQ